MCYYDVFLMVFKGFTQEKRIIMSNFAVNKWCKNQERERETAREQR